MSNWLNQFKGPGGGLGQRSFERAREAGYSPAQIAAAVPGTGLSVGWRLANTVNAVVSSLKSRADAGKQAAAAVSGYQSQISSYQKQLSDYQGQISSLQGQYQSQLKATEKAQSLADEYQGKFQKATADYELAKGEADKYREQAVGQQLRGLRSGATAGGANQTQAGSGGLTGGEFRYKTGESSSSELADRVKEEGGLTDSVLSRKGPVVERMNTADQRQTASRRQPNSGLASGAGTSSYYASRFG